MIDLLEQYLKEKDILPFNKKDSAKIGDWSFIDSSEQTVQQLKLLPTNLIKTEPTNKVFVPTVEKYKKEGINKPVTVYLDSKTGEYVLDDGHHRLQAAKDLGYTKIKAWVRKGLTGGLPNPRLDSIDNIFESEDITQTPEFKKWFGNSKVVDFNGKPLVVYHGTNEDFSEFNDRLFGKNDGGWLGKGFYTTPDIEYAESYADTETGRTLKLFVKSENPYIVTNGEKGSYSHSPSKFRAEVGASNSTEATKIIKSKGYDSIILKEDGGEIVEVVVFEPTQIKSVNNKGVFDPNNPNIYESILNEVAQATGLSREIASRVTGDSRDMLNAIADAAANRQTIKIYYNPKVTEWPNKVKVYRSVQPYSIRMRNIHVDGYNKPAKPTVVFFGYDKYDKDGETIKMFVMDRIRSVEYRTQTFSPKWDIEFEDSEDKEKEDKELDGEKKDKVKESITSNGIYYHATNSLFNKSDIKLISNSVNSTTFGNIDTKRYGFFVTDNIEFAEQFGNNIYSLKVDLNKIITLSSDIKYDFMESIDAYGEDRDLWISAKYYAQDSSSNDWGLFENELGDLFSKYIIGLGYCGVLFKDSLEYSGGDYYGNTVAILNSSCVISMSLMKQDTEVKEGIGSVKKVDFLMGKKSSSGFKTITNSAKLPGTIQVTMWDNNNQPTGHEEYPNIYKALYDNKNEFDIPYYGGLDISIKGHLDYMYVISDKDMVEVYSLDDKKYYYTSPYRPLGSWANVEGAKMYSEDGKRSVLFTDNPLDLEKMKKLELYALSPDAIKSVIKEYADNIWDNNITNIKDNDMEDYEGKEKEDKELDGEKKDKVKESINDVKKLVGKLGFEVEDSSNDIGGYYSGKIIGIPNDDTKINYVVGDWTGENKKDFKSKAEYSSKDITLAHEVCHGLFSIDPARGHIALNKLQDIGVPKTVAFESLMDLGGLFLIEPDAITNPDIKEILSNWLENNDMEESEIKDWVVFVGDEQTEPMSKEDAIEVKKDMNLNGFRAEIKPVKPVEEMTMAADAGAYEIPFGFKPQMGKIQVKPKKKKRK